MSIRNGTGKKKKVCHGNIPWILYDISALSALSTVWIGLWVCCQRNTKGMNMVRPHIGHTENRSHCLVMKSGILWRRDCLVRGKRGLPRLARTTPNMVII